MADQINITVVENVEIINITVSTSVPNIIVEVSDPGGGGGGAVDSVNGQTGVVVLTTTNINEGSNLYFTAARAIAALAATLLNYVTNSSLANTLLNYATTLQLADKQDKRIVISINTTAVIDGAYTLVANATFTDPTPQEGKGFSVLIRNGIATIGGTTYSTTGTIVWRVFHSGSWTNYVNELFIAPGTTAQYYRGDKTFQTLDKTAVGLGNVPNLDTSTTANITDSTNKRFVTDANLTVINNTSGTNTGNETAASIGAIVNGATNYTTPQDADKIGIWDVANALFKALTWANLKATLKTYFDTLYATVAGLSLKSDIASPTFTGTVTTPAIIVSSETASRVAIIDGSKNVKSADTTTYPSLAELAFIKGLLSNGQTQLDQRLITIVHQFTTGTNPLDSTNYYIGEFSQLALTTSATARKSRLPYGYTIIAANIQIITAGVLATNENSTLSIRLNNTTDVLVSNTVKFNVVLYQEFVTGLAINILSTDEFQSKLLTPAWATNPTIPYGTITYYLKRT